MDNNVKYYIATEHPIELNKELKNYVGIYSKSKKNNKSIVIKELHELSVEMRQLFKNDFVYQIIVETINLSYENLMKIIKYNIFNEFNAIEIYCTKNENLNKNQLKSVVKNLDEQIIFELDTLTIIGRFKLDKVNICDKENVKILGMAKINNKFIVDIQSFVIFYFDENNNIDEIGISTYIQEIKINNLTLELDSSHNVYGLKYNEIQSKKNAFESAILSKYKENNINENNICITRFVYNINEIEDDISSIDLILDINGELEKYLII